MHGQKSRVENHRFPVGVQIIHVGSSSSGICSFLLTQIITESSRIPCYFPCRFCSLTPWLSGHRLLHLVHCGLAVRWAEHCLQLSIDPQPATPDHDRPQLARTSHLVVVFTGCYSYIFILCLLDYLFLMTAFHQALDDMALSRTDVTWMALGYQYLWPHMNQLQ